MHSAVQEEVCEQAIIASKQQTIAELRQSCCRELHRVGRYPVASTGIMDAFVQACRVASWIKIIDEIDQLGAAPNTGGTNAKDD